MTAITPPFDAICPECITRAKHPIDTTGALFYCGHRENMAVKLPNFRGWYVVSEINPAEFLAMIEKTEVDLFAALKQKSPGGTQ